MKVLVTAPVLRFVFAAVCCVVPASAQQGPASAPAPVRHVRVLDEHAAPVIGAELAFRAPGQGDLAEACAADCEPAFAGLPRVRTDGNGLAALPTALAAADVIARAGERFGAGTLAFDDPLLAEPILWVAPDREVRVVVRGADGAPRGGVLVEARGPQSRADDVRSRGQRFFGPTAADGTLTLHHVQGLCRWDLAHPALRLRASVAGSEVPFVKVGLESPAAAPVVLPCPPFGWIAVFRWLAEGVPDGLEPRFSGTMVQPDPDAHPPAVGFSGAAVPQRVGEWRSHPVALGRRWLLHDDLRSIEVAGPTHADEVTRVDVFENPGEEDTLRATVSAVLESADGTPCANAGVDLGPAFTGGEGGSTGRLRTRTDAQGRVQFAASRVTFLERITLWVPERDLVFRRELTAEEKGSRLVTLGRLRPSLPPQIVASGRLFDGGTRLPVQGSVFVRRGDIGLSESLGPDGAFSILCDPEDLPRLGTTLEIQFGWRSGGVPMQTRKLAVGATDVELVLARPSSLRCSVLVDPGLTGLPWLRAIDPTGEAHCLHGTRSRQGLLEFGCTLERETLEPERWCLEVLDELDHPVLRTGPGVGFARTPEGLAATLDLRGRLVAFDLALDLEPFVPICTQGQMYVREAGTDQPWRETGLLPFRRLLGKPGTRLEAVLCPFSRMTTRVVLSPGLTEVELPRPAVFEIDVQATGVPEERLFAFVLLLQGREPLFDELERGGVREVWQKVHGRRSDRTWPMSAKELAEFAPASVEAGTPLHAGTLRESVPRLGSYVVLPFVTDGERCVLLPAAAIVLEAKAPGQVVAGTLRIHAEQVQAALGGK